MAENTSNESSRTIAAPAAPPPNPVRSPSFEAALAAIRSAWDQSPRAAPPPSPAPAEVADETPTLTLRQPDDPASTDGHGCDAGMPRPEPEHVAGPQPVQDEWGLFDPNKCGFPALVEKLNDVADEDDSRKKRTTVRVISYG